MQEKIYYIEGMHCGSCELLIEKRLLKENGVKAVDASFGNSTLRIEYDGRVPHVKDLNNWFRSDKYSFSETKQVKEKDLMIFFQDGKGLQIDKKILKRRFFTLLKVAIVFFVLYLLQGSGIGQYVSLSDKSSLGVFFTFGLVAGLSSCAALVGGILLSLTKSWSERYSYDAGVLTKMVPHFYFHAGRLVSYILLGGLLGYLGKAVAFENVTVYAGITIVVSVVMFLIGLQMAGVKWIERFQIRMPKFVTRSVAGTKTKNGNQLPFTIGAGTILLPCGFTLIAQGIALTSGSAVKGAMMLGMFVIGTMIPLLFIGVASVKGSANPKRGRIFSFYAGVVLVIFAMYNINGQMNVLGFPSVTDVFASSSKSGNIETKSVVDKKGTQTVTVLAKGFSYTFIGSSSIKANVPAKLVVDNQGMQGCGIFLSARGLINGFVDLKPGQNIIDLGKPKKGSYKITCSMGMVQPITLHVI